MRLYCHPCESEATDESCPHWDYEHDPRRPLTDAMLRRWKREYAEDMERAARGVPAWFVQEGA